MACKPLVNAQMARPFLKGYIFMAKNKNKQQKENVVINGLNEVIQPTYNQNNRLMSFGEIVSGADYGLLSTKPNVLTNTYKNNSFAQIAVDLPVQDAFRDGGFTLDSQTLNADELLELNDFMDDQGDRNILKDACRWGRLFGGGAVIASVGKNQEIPLNIEGLYKKEVEFLASDRWQTTPIGSSIYSAEKFLLQDLNSKKFEDAVTLHKSRLKLFIPKIEPYYIRNMLQGWGASIFEDIIPSLAQYIKANSVILELLDEAKIDILKIFGLSDVLMSAEGEAAVRKRLRIFADQKNFQSVGAMDVKDDYVQKQLSFGSLDQMIEKIMLLICSSLRIPYSKVFGKGASGFSSGEDDLENYNGMVMSTIREPIKPIIKWMLDIRCMQLFGRKIDDLVITWKPLRVLNEVDQQNVITQKINSYIQLCQLGVMTKKQVAEQLTTDKIILFKPEELDAIPSDYSVDEMEQIVNIEDIQNSVKNSKKFFEFWKK